MDHYLQLQNRQTSEIKTNLTHILFHCLVIEIKYQTKFTEFN